MIGRIKLWDRKTAEYFESVKYPLLDDFFMSLSALGSPTFTAILLGTMIPLDFSLFRTTATGVLLFWFLGYSTKFLGSRNRPEFDRSNEKNFSSSFPSVHSGTVFVVAIALSQSFTVLQPFLYLLASLVAVSRLYLGNHYLTDVLAGSALGIAVGLLVAG